MTRRVYNNQFSVTSRLLMTKQAQLIRTCTACGIEKPLAAFLQISGKQGTNYGSVCASCRSAGRTAKSPPIPIEEDSTTATTDVRIGSKEKVYAEQEKKRYLKDLKGLHIKEAKKRDEAVVESVEQKDIKEKAEKDHRKFYIETKQKQGFLGQRRPVDPNSADGIAERNAKQQLEHARNLLENRNQIETQKQEEIIKQEFQITSLDFSMPFIAGQTNQLRFQTDTFLKFKSWLGMSSPIVRTLELLYNKNNMPTTPGKNPPAENANRKEKIEEYMDKRLDNPSSTRRR